jgi:tetratricopeptide (TPR) repeat protein
MSRLKHRSNQNRNKIMHSRHGKALVLFLPKGHVMKPRMLSAALLLAATVAMGQAAPSQPPTQGQPQTQGAQPGDAAAPAVSHQPQAKTNDELAAFKLAAAKTDPAQVDAAADEFAQKFPDSELKVLLYVRAMNLYQQQNNSGKVVVVGRKAIALNATDPVPLVTVASALVLDTQDNDLDRAARYNEAAKDAQAALDNIDTGLQIPPGVTADRVAVVKANLRSIAYDTLGVIAMKTSNFPGAEEDFKKAVELMKDQPDASVYLRLAVVQDNQGKYAEALESANKAAQYSQDGSTERVLAKQEQDRLTKLIAEKNGTQAAPAATPPPPQPAQPH